MCSMLSEENQADEVGAVLGIRMPLSKKFARFLPLKASVMKGHRSRASIPFGYSTRNMLASANP